MRTVVGGAVARTVPLCGKKAFASLARTVAHFGHNFIVHCVDVGVVDVAVGGTHAALVAN